MRLPEDLERVLTFCGVFAILVTLGIICVAIAGRLS